VDPNATLAHLLTAIADAHVARALNRFDNFAEAVDEVDNYATHLRDWLAGGGFEPDWSSAIRVHAERAGEPV
jgi:hypothetical protein